MRRFVLCILRYVQIEADENLTGLQCRFAHRFPSVE